MSQVAIRIGEVNFNKYGSKMIIEKYNNSKSIVVKFPLHNYSIFTTYELFKKGIVKNPYDKSVCGVGYLGEGKYKISENGQPTPQYTVWRNMIQRCYDEKQSRKYPTYNECTIIEDWHCFQIFAEWYSQNYYEVDNQTMELDKDILIKGNKIYSPDTCIFVPHVINTLFLKHGARRGKYPIGMYWDKEKKKYRVQCNDLNSKIKRLGRYSTIEDAFMVYKNYKENIIKQVAEEYKDLIPENLYVAMMNYKVEITD